MPKRTDISKILIIGSGPIVIGQSAEFVPPFVIPTAAVASRSEATVEWRDLL
jgi:hypothetical protein